MVHHTRESRPPHLTSLCCLVPQDGKPLSRLALWNLEFCHEALNMPGGAEIDAKLDYAYAERQTFRDPGSDSTNDWGGKRKKDQNKKEWRKWRKAWLRDTMTRKERRALRRRQNQRRLVRDTGACAMEHDPSDASRLARISFKQSPAWEYLSMVRVPPPPTPPTTYCAAPRV